jgi:hypothetical protein
MISTEHLLNQTNFDAAVPDEIAALDAESAEILAEIGEMGCSG